MSRKRTPPSRRPGPDRPRRSASRHRVAAFHVLWLAVSVGFVMEAALLVDRLDDEYTTFAVFGGTAALWGFLGAATSVVASPPATGKGSRRVPAVPPGPVPWRLPWVAAYAGVVPALVLVGGLLGADESGAAVTQTLMWAFVTLLGWLTGLAAALLVATVWIVVIGVVGFGGPALTGEADGEPVPRAPYVGPFVAVVGLLALPVVLVGPFAYDSPYRRDVAPLVGVVRDGVDVTHPHLLLAAQVATWWCLAGLAIGFVVFRLAAARHAVVSPSGHQGFASGTRLDRTRNARTRRS